MDFLLKSLLKNLDIFVDLEDFGLGCQDIVAYLEKAYKCLELEEVVH